MFCINCSHKEKLILFNSKNLLKPFCDDIIDDLNIDYNNYQRIVSPLFYIGEVLDRSNNKSPLIAESILSD